MSKTVLVVTPVKDTVIYMEAILPVNKYVLRSAPSPQVAFTILNREAPDIVLLEDVDLQLKQNEQFIQALRNSADYQLTPILMLSRVYDLKRMAWALDVGADNYLEFPISSRVMQARIQSHCRLLDMAQKPDHATIYFIPKEEGLLVNDIPIPLTRIEYRLVAHLCQRSDHWYQPEDLLTQVWNYPRGKGDSALVRNHVRNVRRKVERETGVRKIIQSRHGRGYAIDAKVLNQPGVRHSAP